MTPLNRVGISMILLCAGMASCDRKGDSSAKSGAGGAVPSGAAADNTARNAVDQNGATKTPLDQSNSASDIKITADVRREIMTDKSMSMNAQNCKIITDKGVVTLRGPVTSQTEKDAIESKAKATAGVSKVVNELEVKP